LSKREVGIVGAGEERRSILLSLSLRQLSTSPLFFLQCHETHLGPLIWYKLYLYTCGMGEVAVIVVIRKQEKGSTTGRYMLESLVRSKQMVYTDF